MSVNRYKIIFTIQALTIKLIIFYSDLDFSWRLNLDWRYIWG